MTDERLIIPVGDAIKQITDRGYSVADVFQRLGISMYSLYAWMKLYSTVSRVAKLGRLAGNKSTDITYIKTYESFAYLSVVIDLYSRRVIVLS